ncbi:hypothetical protein N9W00_00630 [Arcobacteraceae bacterium]|nr:hypothetical protein [Arcobacteraceae bacterium]
MLNKNNSDIELLEIAKVTTNIEILNKLKNNSSPTIRRAVARSKYASSEILEYLSNDPVLNVTYMVHKNDNCSNLGLRELADISNPCVTCLEDERYRDCHNCNMIKEYYATT